MKKPKKPKKPKEKPVKLNMSFEEAIDLALKTPVKKKQIKATLQARKILEGLNEARQIQTGKRKATTFDEFLNEL